MSAAVTAALHADRYGGSAGSPHEAGKHVSKVAHKASAGSMAGSRKHAVQRPPQAMPQAMPQTMRPAALPNQSLLPSAAALPSPPNTDAEGVASACHAACRASSRGQASSQGGTPLGGSTCESSCVDSTGHAGHLPPPPAPPFLPHMNADGWAMRYVAPSAPAPPEAEMHAETLQGSQLGGQLGGQLGSPPLLASAAGKVRRNALTTRPHHSRI